MREVKYETARPRFSAAELEMLHHALVPTPDLLSYHDATGRLLELLLEGGVDADAQECLDLARAMKRLNDLFSDMLDDRGESAGEEKAEGAEPAARNPQHPGM